MLRNILGPVLNTTLDQFLTQDFFGGGRGAETPIFVVLSAKCKILKKHKKLFVSTPVLTALVKMSVSFSAFFILGFLQYPIFSEMFFW